MRELLWGLTSAPQFLSSADRGRAWASPSVHPRQPRWVVLLPGPSSWQNGRWVSHWGPTLIPGARPCLWGIKVLGPKIKNKIRERKVGGLPPAHLSPRIRRSARVLDLSPPAECKSLSRPPLLKPCPPPQLFMHKDEHRDGPWPCGRVTTKRGPVAGFQHWTRASCGCHLANAWSPGIEC